MSEFIQEPPRLENQYLDDKVLRNSLARVLPAEVLLDIEPTLRRMGDLAAGRLFELSKLHRCDEPELTRFDPWGHRVDEIRVSPAWKEMARVACEEGLVATPYERSHGQYSRIHQFALAYLFLPSALSYGCPLGMSDGAAKTILTVGTQALQREIVPRLIHRDPSQVWTSGQWMTERIGGSDVSRSQTVARLFPEGWRLYGTKWFTSAADSDIALTLARPEGNAQGSKGLALFLVKQRDETGKRNGIRIHRLKEKLGTRVLPTAELTMEGTLAEAVAGLTDGVRNIAPMLNITRLWNAIDSVAVIRRGLALARDYASKRLAFDSPLSEKPLHLETVAELQTQFQSSFVIAFHAAELLGQEEAGMLDDEGKAVLRLLLPVTKLLTARQAVAAASEILECFGGAGYIEDTGLPVLLRDAQVLSIWEGTTNVLALDALRSAGKRDALGAFLRHAKMLSGSQEMPGMFDLSDTLEAWGAELLEWYESNHSPALMEAGARRFAMELGKIMQLALLRAQAKWDLEHLHDGTADAVARRFCECGLPSPIAPELHLEESRAIALQGGLPTEEVTRTIKPTQRRAGHRRGR